MQIELGWDFGQSAAFRKKLDLLFLKAPKFSKSVEKWPSYGVKRLKMVLKCVFRLKFPLESHWNGGGKGVGWEVGKGLERAD